MDPTQTMSPWSHHVVGIKVDGAGPLTRGFVSLGDGTGLHLLYGRNGAGKSSVLRALREPGPEAATVIRTARPGGLFVTDDEDELVEYLESVVASRSGRELASRLAKEFARTRHFLFDGRTYLPVVLPSETTPALNAEMARLQSDFATLIAEHGDAVEGTEAYQAFEDALIDFQQDQAVGDLWQGPGDYPEPTEPLFAVPGLPPYAQLRPYECSPWHLGTDVSQTRDLRRLAVSESTEGLTTETAEA